MGNARDIRFSLTGPVDWAGKPVQIEVTVNAVQEGCQAIADAVVEKRRTKAREPGCPQGMTKATQAPAAAYNNEDWMWGLEEEAPKWEAGNGDVGDHGLDQRSAHSQHAG